MLAKPCRLAPEGQAIILQPTSRDLAWEAAACFEQRFTAGAALAYPSELLTNFTHLHGLLLQRIAFFSSLSCVFTKSTRHLFQVVVRGRGEGGRDGPSYACVLRNTVETLPGSEATAGNHHHSPPQQAVDALWAGCLPPCKDSLLNLRMIRSSIGFQKTIWLTVVTLPPVLFGDIYWFLRRTNSSSSMSSLVKSSSLDLRRVHPSLVWLLHRTPSSHS